MPTEVVPATVPAWHGPHVSSGWFKGIKAQCGGFQFMVGGARFSTTVCFETACHSSLSATSPPLVPSAWAVSINNPSSDNLLCMDRSSGHALMCYSYSQAVHKTIASNFAIHLLTRWSLSDYCSFVKVERKSCQTAIDLAYLCISCRNRKLGRDLSR